MHIQYRSGSVDAKRPFLCRVSGVCPTFIRPRTISAISLATGERHTPFEFPMPMRSRQHPLGFHIAI